MSRRDNVRSLEDMLVHAREAVAMLENASADSLESDRQLHLSLQRLLEIIGEAANRVPRTKQEQHPEIPWAEIIAMRNRVIHGYDQVDIELVQDTVAVDLPVLIRQLNTMLDRR